MLVVGAGVLAGLYFANAPSQTGIYKLPLGQLLANVYTAGANLAGGLSAVAPAVPASVSTTAIPAASI